MGLNHLAPEGQPGQLSQHSNLNVPNQYFDGHFAEGQNQDRTNNLM